MAGNKMSALICSHNLHGQCPLQGNSLQGTIRTNPSIDARLTAKELSYEGSLEMNKWTPSSLPNPRPLHPS